MPFFLAATDSPWNLLIPGGTVIIVWFVASTAYHRWKWLELWLEESHGHRLAFTAVGLICAVLATIAGRLPDFAKIIHGTIETNDCGLLALLLVLAGVPIWVQLTLLRHSDRWNQKFSDAEKRVSQAQDAERQAKREVFFHLWVSQCFLKAIGVKRTSVHQALSDNGMVRIDQPHEVINRYVAAANPRRQVAALVNVVYDIYRELLNQIDANATLRVAYFAESDGSLVPIYCWDGADTNCLVTATGKIGKARLGLKGNQDRCLAVAAACSKNIEIISDAQKSHDKKDPFQFFDNNQRRRIQSMVALPLGDIEGAEHHGHVICIDTNMKGFFDKNQIEQLELVRRNLAQRLLCELHMAELLGVRNRAKSKRGRK